MIIFRILLVFLLFFYTTNAKASICENIIDEVQCIKFIIDDIHKTETFDHIKAPYLESSIQSYLPLMGKKPAPLWKEYTNSKRRKKEPVSLLYIYHLINENKYDEIIQFLTTTDELDFVDPKHINLQPKGHVDPKHVRDLRIFCGTIGFLFILNEKQGFLEKLEKETFCGKAKYIPNILRKKAMKFVKDGKYHKESALYSKCEDDILCQKSIITQTLECLEFSSRNLDRNDERYKNLKEFLQKLGQRIETLDHARPIPNMNFMRIFVRSLSKSELMQFLTTTNSDLYPYEIPDEFLRRKRSIKKLIFDYFANAINNIWPKTSDEEVSNLISEIDQFQTNTALPDEELIPLNHYSGKLYKNGFPNAAVVATKAKSNLPSTLPRYKKNEADTLRFLKNAVEENHEFPEFIKFIEGAHKKCMDKEEKTLFQCIEDTYLSLHQDYNISRRDTNCSDLKKEEHIQRCKLDSFKHKQVEEFRVAMWKIERGAFEEAIRLLKDIDEKDYAFRSSFSDKKIKLSLLKQTKKREFDFTGDILNIRDPIFEKPKCMGFIQNHPDAPFEFDENYRDLIIRTSAFIYMKCLKNLPTNDFKAVITSNDKYKTESSSFFSNTFKFNFNYSPENDEKIQFALQYPYLTKHIEERVLKLIKSGYQREPIDTENRNDFLVFLKEYSDTDSLKERVRLLGSYLSYKNKELMPEFPTPYEFCQ